MSILASGPVQAINDFRAPIFYDSGNTAYYLDPAGTSALQSVTLSTLNAGTSVTAPIYYDSADSSYYMDPAGTSRLSTMLTSNGAMSTPAYSFINDSNTGMYNVAADTLGLSTAGSERLRMHSNGKVSVNNTDSGLGQFSVSNNASVTSYNSTFRMLEGATFKNDAVIGWNVAGQYSHFGNYQSYPLTLRTNDQNRVYITAGGAMGLGVTPTNTTGRFEASNDIVAYSSSDKRWKNNIVKIDSPLEKISQISGVEFDWIEDEPLHGNKGHDVGVIAQEIELVIPEAVQTRESGMKAVQYDKIIPLLIESIKELQKQIKELKK
jgi:hypothetical protein